MVKDGSGMFDQSKIANGFNNIFTVIGSKYTSSNMQLKI